jgi:hypothetical protein
MKERPSPPEGAEWTKQQYITLGIQAARLVLPNFETVYPDDTLPRRSLAIAETIFLNEDYRTRRIIAEYGYSLTTRLRGYVSLEQSAGKHDSTYKTPLKYYSAWSAGDCIADILSACFDPTPQSTAIEIMRAVRTARTSAVIMEDKYTERLLTQKIRFLNPRVPESFRG